MSYLIKNKQTVKWYAFDNYDIKTVDDNTPKVSGVYILWVKQTTGEWNCFYVGQAVDLNDRLSQHLYTSEKNECIKNKVSTKICGFSYATVSLQSDRNGIEKFLYDHYNQPECNIVDPCGTPIEVNL